MHDDLELIAVLLINKRLQAGDEIFVFSAGNLRGKSVSASTGDSIAASIYQKAAGTGELEPCLQLEWLPRPRAADPTKMSTIKYTRNPQFFRMPIAVINRAIKLVKLEPGKWMLNVITTVKD